MKKREEKLSKNGNGDGEDEERENMKMSKRASRDDDEMRKAPKSSQVIWGEWKLCAGAG